MNLAPLGGEDHPKPFLTWGLPQDSHLAKPRWEFRPKLALMKKIGEATTTQGGQILGILTPSRPCTPHPIS